MLVYVLVETITGGGRKFLGIPVWAYSRDAYLTTVVNVI